MDLRREFENPCPALKTVASRRSRGVYRRDRRPLEPSLVDERGRMVRAVGMAQTFLSPAQVDELVALYEAGATLVELGERFGVHRRTAAAHLVRRSVPIRRRGLDECHLAEAVELYAGVLASLPAPRPGSGPTWPPRSTLRTQLVVIENVRGLLSTATECSRYARPRRSACSLTVKNDAGSSSANERPAALRPWAGSLGSHDASRWRRAVPRLSCSRLIFASAHGDRFDGRHLRPLGFGGRRSRWLCPGEGRSRPVQWRRRSPGHGRTADGSGRGRRGSPPQG